MHRDTNILIAVMIFARIDDKNFELIRYATFHKITNGFVKLLNHCQENYVKIEKIVVLIDNSVKNSKLYFDSGFVEDEEIPPDYMHVVKGKREHKTSCSSKQLTHNLDNEWTDETTGPKMANVDNLYKNMGLWQNKIC